MSDTDKQLETFDGDWLSLREAVDHQSRDAGLTGAAADWLRVKAAAGRDDRTSFLDLGTGSGSNVRYLAPRLPGPQRWQLFDHDQALLAQARSRCQSLTDATGESVALATRVVNLTALDALAQGGEPCELISASALLDLVSVSWLQQLAGFGQTQGAAILVTLSYDGDFSFARTLPDDALIRDLVNDHQRGQKGFGAALGPDAVPVFERILRDRGFQVSTAASPWQLDHRHLSLQLPLIEGWSGAALQQAALQPLSGQQAAIERWRQQRLAEAGAGEARIRVGHRDLLALPGLGESKTS